MYRSKRKAKIFSQSKNGKITMRIFINVIRRINMPFDYKKEYKEFYLPTNKPSIVSCPK